MIGSKLCLGFMIIFDIHNNEQSHRFIYRNNSRALWKMMLSNAVEILSHWSTVHSKQLLPYLGMWQFKLRAYSRKSFSYSLIVGVSTTDWKSLASSSQASSSESVGLLARVPDTITVFDNSDLRTFYKDVEFSSWAKEYRANMK